MIQQLQEGGLASAERQQMERTAVGPFDPVDALDRPGQPAEVTWERAPSSTT